MKWVYVVMVLVVDDGVWRAWNTYPTLGACEEVIKVLTTHREDKIKAYCLAKEINE